jgi:hypothetical protein
MRRENWQSTWEVLFPGQEALGLRQGVKPENGLMGSRMAEVP